MAGLKFPLEAATDEFWTIDRCVKEKVDPRVSGTPFHLPQNPGLFMTKMTYQRNHNHYKLWVNRKRVEKRGKAIKAVVKDAMGLMLKKKIATGESQSTVFSDEDNKDLRLKLPGIKDILKRAKSKHEDSVKTLTTHTATSSGADNSEFSGEFSSDEEEPEEKDENLKTFSKFQLQYKSFNDKIGTHPIRAIHRQIDTYHIDLRYINVSHLEFKAICLTVLVCPMISRLDLTEVYIDDTKVVFLTELFKDNNFLTDLVMKGCQLGFRQVKRILETLRDRDNLVYLDVSENNLKDDSAFLLAKYMEGSSTLVYLQMARNQFGESAGKYFGMAIGENYYLRYINVSKNHIRRDGARSLMSGLARNHNLDTIDLSWNALREDGAGYIKKVLDDPELKRIDLTGTGMNTICMQQVIAGLKRNTNLEYIGLRNNPCLVEDYTHLLDTVLHNQESHLMQIDLGYQSLSVKAIATAKELNHTRNVDVFFGCQLESQGFMLGDQVGMMKLNMAMNAISKLKHDKRIALAHYFKIIDHDTEQSAHSLHMKKVERDCTFNAQAERGVISYRSFALRLLMAGDNPERTIEEAEKEITTLALGATPNLNVIRSEPDFFANRDMELRSAFRADIEDMADTMAKVAGVVQFT